MSSTLVQSAQMQGGTFSKAQQKDARCPSSCHQQLIHC